MCLVGNPNELVQKMAYLVPLVERMSTITGALTITNDRGFDALYLTALNSPEFPFVAGYLAAAMLQKGIDISQRLYHTRVCLLRFLHLLKLLSNRFQIRVTRWYIRSRHREILTKKLWVNCWLWELFKKINCLTYRNVTTMVSMDYFLLDRPNSNRYNNKCEKKEWTNYYRIIINCTEIYILL